MLACGGDGEPVNAQKEKSASLNQMLWGGCLLLNKNKML
jgi:hypothetical protein